MVMRNRKAAIAAWVVTLALPVTAARQTVSQPVETPKISMSRLVGGKVLVEVSDPMVRIQKEIGRSNSNVVIATAADELQVAIQGGEVRVSTLESSVTLNEADSHAFSRLAALLQRSEAARRGRALLARLEPTARNPGYQALLLTRMILEAGGGRQVALAAHRQWIQDERLRLFAATPTTAVLRVAAQERGPGDCWDEYAKEAIRIADDLQSCLRGSKWWQLGRQEFCGIEYVIRAEGAFFWYLGCNGGFPFSG